MSWLISIGIPVFNGAKFLPRTIKSLLDQSYRQFECFLYDDCSSDNSAEIITQLTGMDSRFTLKKGDINIGSVPQIIKDQILPELKGQFFQYMSQDDFLEKDCLEKAIKNVKNTGAEISLFDFVFYDPKNSQNKKIVGIGGKNLSISGKEAFKKSLNWEIAAAGIYDITLVRKCGYYVFNMFADEYSVRNFMLNAKKVSFNGGLFYYNIDNDAAVTQKIKPELFSALYAETLLFELTLKNFKENLILIEAQKRRIVQMFFDYRIWYKQSDFNINESDRIKNYFNESRQLFNSLDFPCSIKNFEFDKASVKFFIYFFLIKYSPKNLFSHFFLK